MRRNYSDLIWGFVSTLLPFWTWNAAQKYLPISTLAMTAYFTPIIAVALGVVFLQEGVTPLQWLGTVFVIASALVETVRNENERNERNEHKSQRSAVR